MRSLTFGLLCVVGCGGGAIGERPVEPEVVVPAEASSGSAAASTDTDTTSPPTGDETPMLGDHLRVSLPAGAKVVARGHSIMAAEEPDETETRVVLEQGDREGVARFVLLVSELNLLSSGEVSKDAEKLLGKGEVAKAFDGAKLPTAEIAVPPPSDGPIPVLASVIAHADGTLQQAVFYILPDLRKDQATYRARAVSIAKTFVVGARKSTAPGGPIAIANGLTIDVPPGYVSVLQRGPDFDVRRITKLRRPGEPPMSLGVYIGGHPSLQHTQAARESSTPLPKKSEPGTLLGQSTTWENWTTSEGSLVREAMAKLGGDFIHVFAFAPDRASMTEAMAIAKTLRKK